MLTAYLFEARYMFAQGVGLEQKEKKFGFEMITIGPGMVDTYMQQVARSKTVEEYASADYCRQAFEQGMLDKPESVVKKIDKTKENRRKL